MDLEERAREDAPKLKHLCERLLKVADKLMSERPVYDDNDHFGLMALCFIERQRYHLRSVLKLIENDTEQDAQVIARIMLEGMCTLKWAENNKETVPIKWRAFAWVEDFRLIKRQEKAGIKVDPLKKETVRSYLEEYGHLFERENRKYKGNTPDEDPYSKFWYGDTKVKSIFNSVAPSNYYESYDEASKWVHWTVKSVGYAFNPKVYGLYFDLKSISTVANALNIAFAALFQTLEILSNHFGIPDALILEEIRGQFKTEIAAFFEEPHP